MRWHRHFRTGFALALVVLAGLAYGQTRRGDEERAGGSLRIVDAMPSARRIATADHPAAFRFRLDASPGPATRAFLTYELEGLPHWTAALRSLNGLPPFGGFAAAAASGPALQLEEVNPRWLKPGVNEVVFLPLDGEAIPYAVRNVRVVLVHEGPQPGLRITHPIRGETAGDGALVTGFVDPAVTLQGPAELFVDGVHVSAGIRPEDGTFAVFAPKRVRDGEPWEVEVEVVYPDGTSLRQAARIEGETEKRQENGEAEAEPDKGKHGSADSANAANTALTTPDEPSGASFSPNSLQELAKADPAAEIVLIEPPEGGPTGDVMLDFPLVVPPGRGGLEPELALRYNSSAGDGWLGMGWDLALSSIEISTLFGVPRYDGSERYLLDGEQLTPSGEPGRFIRRSEGSFDRIVRHGNGANDYWWEVTDKDGTRSLYGQTAQARLQDPRGGNVFRWHLQRVIDLHGNTVDYSYFTDGGSGGEPWVEIYPLAITYSGGFYQVRFVLDDGTKRQDRLSSGRPGFKTVARRRLDAVEVLAGEALVRRYLLHYVEGKFRKSLLQAVAVTGDDGETELAHHAFTYYGMRPEDVVEGFGEPVNWGALSATESEPENFNVGGGAHAFVGVGDTSCTNHVGPQVGGNFGFSDVQVSFLDVNGDGLPDRVAQDGTVALNGFDVAAGSGGFAGSGTLAGADTLEHTLQWSFDFGAGLHALQDLAIAGLSWVWSHANDERAVADVNGDGFPDLVGSGAVRFNDGNSFGKAVPLTSGGGSFDLAVPGESEDILGSFKLSSPLRQLVLPMTGSVNLTGAVRKKEAGGDGITVEIHHNRRLLWRRTIGGDETAPCTPTTSVPGLPGDDCGEGLTLSVEEGDSLYFLAGANKSTVADGLLWAPRVVYTSVTSGSAPSLVFDAAADFSLEGSGIGSVLSGGHRGWFYGEWDGSVLFDEHFLSQPEDKNAVLHWVAARPHPEGVSGVSGGVWKAAGFDLYIAAEGVKPSRQGMDAATVLSESNGGPGLVRRTSGATVGFDLSVGPLGASPTCGASDTQLDLIDLNGDLYPDQVMGKPDLTTDLEGLAACGGLNLVGGNPDGAVRLADGRGGFADIARLDGLESPVRRTTDVSVGLNLGLGINVPRKSGKGGAQAIANTMPASTGSALSLSQTTTDLVDVNGDGLPDRVSMAPGDDRVTVRLNLGYRFGAEEEWTLPSWEDDEASCHDGTQLGIGELTDLTGFGTFDVLRHASSSLANVGVALGPIGGGTGTSLNRTLVDLVDVDGDGLPDHVSRDDGGSFQVKLNHGDRWGDEETWSDPCWPGSALDHHGLFQCLDAIRSSGDINTSESVGAPICIPLKFVGIRIEVSGQASQAFGGGEVAFEDFDGDGLADRVLKGSDGTVWVKPNLAAKANLLVQVDRPLGGSIALDYRRQGNRVDHTDPDHRIDMPASQWVLSATTVADGRGNQYRTEYDYFNDAFHDRAERESYGYARVQATLPDDSRIDRHFHNQDLFRRHLMTREAISDAAGNLFRVHTSTYELRPLGPDAAFPALVREETHFHEGLAEARKSTFETFDYDAFGNVITSHDAADAGAEDDVDTAIVWHIDPEAHVHKPASVEVRNRGNLLRRRVGTYDDHGDLVRLEQTLLGGRDPASGLPYTGSRNAVWTYAHDAFGNLASSTDPSGFVSSFTYDPVVATYPVQVRDSFGYVTRYAWDLKHGAPTETIDENGNALRRAYDGFGRLVRVVGPYDSDAAPTLAFEYGHTAQPAWAVVHHQDATRSDPIDSAVFIDGLGRVLQTKEDAELDMGSGTSTRTGMRVSGRVEFDVKGRVAAQSQPVFDDRPAAQFIEVPVKNPTRLTYDVLDRVREARYPHGAVTRLDYGFGALDGVERLRQTRIDPNGRATLFYSDVNGDVLGVEQSNTIGGAKKTLVTRYGYDALAQLIAVTDAKGSVTRLEHDTLGRNVVLDNPDLGRTEYRYDPAGNLGAKITANLAARGQQIRYLNTFHRLDRIDYPETADVAFTYGSPGAPDNRATRIVTVTNESGVEEHSYGKLGEIVRTVKTATALNGNSPKGPYVTSSRFDSFGRLLSVVYPDGEELTYGYDAGGQVKSAAGVLAGVRFDYLRHQGYDEFGARTRIVYGNGVETRYAYDSRSRDLAQLQTFESTGREIQDLRYQYDLTSTLLATQNEVPLPSPPLYGGPAAQTFRYDDLYQLIAAEGSYRSPPNKETTYSLALAYDEAGSTVAKNQLHQAGPVGNLKPEKKTSFDWAYTYGGAQPHAPTRIGDRTFRYDANGNQIGWETDKGGARRTLTWDEENRLKAVADNGKTTRFLYDAGGMRTNKAGQHGETIYINKWFSVRNGAVASKHVFADDIRLATKVSPNPNPSSEKVYFYQPDHLGSTHFVTDESGTAWQHLEYFPSGEAWVEESSETQRTPYSFSGKELDEETGLSYFGFRYLDPRQGQWISADPVLEGMLETRTLASSDLTDHPFHLAGHNYAYAANSPTNLTDAVGLCPPPKSCWMKFGFGLGRFHTGSSYFSQPLRLFSTDKANQAKLNREAGAAFEEKVELWLKKKYSGEILKQVSIRPYKDSEKTPADFKFRIDFLVSRLRSSFKHYFEAKGSQSASLTWNQKEGFELFGKYGGKVVGKKGLPSLREGTPLKKAEVNVVRPSDVTSNKKRSKKG